MDAAGAVLSVVTLGLVGLLVWFMVRQASLGRLAPNGLLGIRTRATMSSPESWTAGHTAALPWTARSVCAGLAVSLVGVILTVTGGGHPVLATALVLGGYGVFGLGLVAATLVANKAVGGT